MQLWVKPIGLKCLLLAITCAVCVGRTHGQIKNIDSAYTCVLAVQPSAEFKGGMDKFYSYLAKNVHYPAKAREAKVQGRVIVTFIVETNGLLTHIKVMRGIGYGCDEEAVRVIKASPRWIPAKQRGKVIKQQYTVPVSFKLPATINNNSRASFPGGQDSLYQYLATNIKYPAKGDMDVTGKVIIGFIVEADGSLSGFKVVRALQRDFDTEALRVMKASPKWIPAKKDGRAVRSDYVLPVNFSIAD